MVTNLSKRIQFRQSRGFYKYYHIISSLVAAAISKVSDHVVLTQNPFNFDNVQLFISDAGLITSIENMPYREETVLHTGYRSTVNQLVA